MLLVLARGLVARIRERLQADDHAAAACGLCFPVEGPRLGGGGHSRGDRRRRWSQSALFDRASGGDWLDWTDLGVGFAALLVFVIFGMFSHHIDCGGVRSLDMRSAIACRAARFLRTAASMLVVVGAATLYVVIRTPVHFEPPDEEEIQQTLAAHAAYGTGTTPIMVAVGDKSVFFNGARGFCLYRTIGPYLTVFSDPMVPSASERAAFLDALFAFAAQPRSTAALLSDLPRLDSAAARSRLPLLQAGRGSARPSRSPDARGTRRQADAADPPARRSRRRDVPNHAAAGDRSADRRARRHLVGVAAGESRSSNASFRSAISTTTTSGDFHARSSRPAKADGCWPLPTCWKVRAAKSCRWI